MLKTSDSGQTAKESQPPLDRFRCPESLIDLRVTGHLSDQTGYFRLGDGVICYGRCASGIPRKTVTEALHDASPYVTLKGASVHLPFDATQVVDNLRYERYAPTATGVRTDPDGQIHERWP